MFNCSEITFITLILHKMNNTELLMFLMITAWNDPHIRLSCWDSAGEHC